MNVFCYMKFLNKYQERKFSEKNYLRVYIFLIVVLLISNLFTFAWSVNHVRSHTSFSSKYPYIDISRNFIPQEHFIVNLESLREEINKMVDEFGPDAVSVYIEFLNTGANISINKENYIWPASLTKVPVAMAVMKKIENGEWNLNNQLVLMPGDANQMSGDSKNPLSEYPIGTPFSIERLLEELLVNSDNTAYYILLRNIHQDELKEVIVDIGIEALFSEQGKISAKEYSRIFRTLYTSSFLNRENSQYLLELLDKAVFNEFLSYSIHDKVSFPHKYGQDDKNKAYSDSGVVYLPNRPYIITVMVQGDQNESFENEKNKAADFMRVVSEKAYNFFSNQNN